MDFIDFAVWFAGAVIAVGLIEWAKNLFPKAPPWVWMVVLPVGAFVAAFSIVLKDEASTVSIVWNALGIWSLSQLGYALIVQLVKKRLEKEL